MSKDYCLSLESFPQLEKPASTHLLSDSTAIASPWNAMMGKEVPQLPDQVSLVRLNLEDLKCFEAVERQYQPWGITFKNAIALQPSNPAFPPHSGSIVLLGAPKSGFLEATFSKPVRFVSAFVTSSQRTILSAYDGEDKLLARTELPGPNLAGTDAEFPPNVELKVSAMNIHRVTVYAFDGQTTVDDISFGF